MAKGYNHKLVHSYRSYSVEDVCRLYREQKLHPQTVRGWIKKEGLEAFIIGNAIHVYGAILKQFLKEKSKKRKKPLGVDEFKCWKCKVVGIPADYMVDKLSNGKSKSITAYIDCECGGKLQRSYSREEMDYVLQTFTIKKNEVTGLCDSACSTRKTHIKRKPKEPLSEPMVRSPPENVNCTKNTQIREQFEFSF